MEKKFSVSLSLLYDMLGFILIQAEAIGFENKKRLEIELAAEEALVNIIRHSGLSPQDTFSIQCVRTEPRGIKLILKDLGKRFNPLEHPPLILDTSKPIDKLTPGGFGILLMHEYMDAMDYRYENGMNILFLTKYLE